MCCYVKNKMICRKNELEEEYVNARPQRLKGVWDKLTNISNSSQFASWLANFLGKVASLLSEECNHAESLFGKERSPQVLCSLLQQALKPLALPMKEKLISIDSPISIAEMYNLMDEFARRVIGFIDGCSNQDIYMALTIVFESFLSYSEHMGDRESTFLKMKLLSVLDGVVFDVGGSNSGVISRGVGSNAVVADDGGEVKGEDVLGLGLEGSGVGDEEESDPLLAFER